MNLINVLLLLLVCKSLNKQNIVLSGYKTMYNKYLKNHLSAQSEFYLLKLSHPCLMHN